MYHHPSPRQTQIACLLCPTEHKVNPYHQVQPAVPTKFPKCHSEKSRVLTVLFPYTVDFPTTEADVTSCHAIHRRPVYIVHACPVYGIGKGSRHFELACYVLCWQVGKGGEGAICLMVEVPGRLSCRGRRNQVWCCAHARRGGFPSRPDKLAPSLVG